MTSSGTVVNDFSSNQNNSTQTIVNDMPNNQDSNYNNYSQDNYMGDKSSEQSVEDLFKDLDDGTNY